MKRKSHFLSIIFVTFFFLSGICRAQNKISFKLTGGYGTMSIGDINAVQKHLESSYDEWASLPDATKEGEFKKLNIGFEYEGELIVNITEHLAIGIGAGYIRREKPSDVAFELDTGDLYLHYDIFISPELCAIPIKLSILYSFPVSSRMNLFLEGGVGYYFGTLEYRRRWQSEELYEGWEYYEREEETAIEAKDSGIGFHGGIGFECDVIKNLAFFVEGSARYIKLNDWHGESVEYIGITYEDGITEGTKETTTGALWYYDVILKIREEKPSGSHIRNAKKAEMDLSGISLRMGLRIKF